MRSSPPAAREKRIRGHKVVADDRAMGIVPNHHGRGPMTPEPCAVCDAVVPYSDAVHLTIHTKSDAGVVDEFICPECYESEIAAALE
jgi:hypothetical protein